MGALIGGEAHAPRSAAYRRRSMSSLDLQIWQFEELSSALDSDLLRSRIVYNECSSMKYKGETSTSIICVRDYKVYTAWCHNKSFHTAKTPVMPKAMPKLHSDCRNSTTHLQRHRQNVLWCVPGEQSRSIVICAENTVDGLFC